MIILYIIVTSLFTLGLKIACKEGMILNKLYVLSKRLPSLLYMPLIGCTYCMSSLWSIIIHGLLYLGGFQTNIFLVIISIPCVAALNWILVSIFPLIDEIT